MSFREALNILEDCVDKLIYEYANSHVDNEVDETLLTFIKTEHINFRNAAEEIIKNYNRISVKEPFKTENAIINYEELLEKNKKKYENKLNNYAIDKNKKINQINDNNNEKIVEIQNELQLLHDEITYTNQSLTLKKKHEELKYNEIVEQLEYQISISEKKYIDLISRLNNELITKNDLIHANTSKKIFKLNENHKTTIDDITSKISIIEEDYKKLENELNLQKLKIKDSILILNIKLNEKINTLTSSKNIAITDIKKEYQSCVEQEAIDTSNLRKEYSEQNRAVLKEFALKLTEIDKRIDTLERKFNSEKEELLRNFYYKNYSLERDETLCNEKYQENLAKVSSNILTKEINLSYRLELRAIKAKQKILNNQQAKSLFDLNKNYVNNLESLKTSKYLFEIEKNYDIKNLALKSTNEHTKLNILEQIREKTFNTNLNLENEKIKLKINDLKSNNEIRIKQYEKELNILQLNYKIKLDDIESSRRKKNFELDYYNHINTMTLNHENTLLQKKKSLNQVLTLLEIERNKVLCDFNKDSYNLTVEKHKLECEKTIKYLENDNLYKISILKEKINKLRIELNNLENTTNFLLLKQENLETYKQSISKIAYIRDIGLEKHKLYLKRYRFELIFMHQTYSTFKDLIITFNIGIKKIATFVAYYVTKDLRKHLVYSEFFSKILDIALSFKTSLIYTFKNKEKEIIEGRIDFETGFKYNSLVNDASDNLNLELSKIENKKMSLNETLENYTSTTDSFYQRIYDLENEKSLIIGNSKRNSLELHVLSNIERIEFTIKDYNKKILNIEKMIQNIKHELDKIPSIINSLNNKHKQKIDKLKREQRKEAAIYYKIISKIERASEDYQSLNKKTYNLAKITSSYKFVEFLNDYPIILKKTADASHKKFLKLNKKLVDTVSNNHNSMKMHYIKNYNKSIKHAKATLVENEINRKKAIKNNLVVYKNSLYENEFATKHIEVINKRNNFSIQNDFNNKMNLNKKNTITTKAKFENNSLSLNDNINCLKEKTTSEFFNLVSNYNKDTKEENNKFFSYCNEIDLRYQESFRRTNREIQNMPITISYQTRDIVQDYKNKNLDINNEIRNINQELKDYIISQNSLIDQNKAIVEKTITLNNNNKNKEKKQISNKFSLRFKTTLKSINKEYKK